MIGERLIITDKHHPWVGYAGVVVDEPGPTNGAAIVVRLDQGTTVVVFADQLVRRLSSRGDNGPIPAGDLK